MFPLNLYRATAWRRLMVAACSPSLQKITILFFFCPTELMQTQMRGSDHG